MKMRFCHDRAKITKMVDKRGQIAVANKAVIKAKGKYLILLKSDLEDVNPNSYDLPVSWHHLGLRCPNYRS